MSLLFVVNPISGGVDKEPFMQEAKAICNKYAIDFEIFRTTGNKDEENLKAKVAEYEPDKVVSVGGDGTTLFTGVCLQNTGVPMGIIPLGSANGMATELYVNPNPIEALKDIMFSNVYADLDLILVNDKEYCLHIGDVGMNARIVDKYSQDERRGMITYAKYFTEEIFNKKPFNYSITMDGKEYKGEALMIAICNARKYGTGVALNKNGNPFDGKFELSIVHTINAQSLLRAGLSRLNENLIEGDNLEVLSGQEASIRFPEEHRLQLDGELIGKMKEVDLKILKAAIRFISHKDNRYLSS